MFGNFAVSRLQDLEFLLVGNPLFFRIWTFWVDLISFKDFISILFDIIVPEKKQSTKFLVNLVHRTCRTSLTRRECCPTIGHQGLKRYCILTFTSFTSGKLYAVLVSNSVFIYTHFREMMKCVARDGSLSLPYMMTVMVWDFVSNTYKL